MPERKKPYDWQKDPEMNDRAATRSTKKVIIRSVDPESEPPGAQLDKIPRFKPLDPIEPSRLGRILANLFTREIR